MLLLSTLSAWVPLTKIHTHTHIISQGALQPGSRSKAGKGEQVRERKERVKSYFPGWSSSFSQQDDRQTERGCEVEGLSPNTGTYTVYNNLKCMYFLAVNALLP